MSVPAVGSGQAREGKGGPVLGGLVALGAVSFLVALATGTGTHAWAVFLANLLFWSGLSAAGPAIAGIFELTEARWASRLRRIATTTVAFMPVSFVLFLLLLVGMRALYPWVSAPIPSKAVWLNVPFFVLRTVVGVGALYWVSVRFAQAVHGSPAGAAQEPGRAARARLAVCLLFLFVIVGSVLGYDLVMTLDPHWFSALLGGFVVVGMLYSGFAFLVLLTGVYSFGRPGWVLPPKEMQDLAKLVFATSVLWMYFFWSQYLVIWYGNVPVETRYVLARFFADPWRSLAVTAFLIGWVIPFSYLLGRLTGRPPEGHRVLVAISCLSLLAILLERLVLVLPSTVPSGGGAYGGGDVLLTLLMTLGFGALFALSFRVFVPRLGLSPRGEA
jgi:Ni/Fe-hydrogenase subunit HybB-like protein